MVQKKISSKRKTSAYGLKMNSLRIEKNEYSCENRFSILYVNFFTHNLKHKISFMDNCCYSDNNDFMKDESAEPFAFVIVIKLSKSRIVIYND